MAAGSVDCLIFSKDRGCQLDLLLRSIDRYARDVYSTLTVLWAASSREFGRGYQVCFAEHARAKFIAEDRFEDQVRHWLRIAGERVSFLCDDDVFYADAAVGEPLPWSFRGGDYDYPFSLDGNVYSHVDVEVLLHGLRFRGPTELESGGHEHRSRLPFQVVNFGTPCLVGVPLNRVSAASGMPSMGRHEYDLNELYLLGQRLAPPTVAGPVGAHAELELAFA